MSGTPGHQQHLHQCQESYTHRTCRMGFSCSFVQSMEGFGCIGLWGQVVGAANLKCAHALCFLLIGEGKIRDGYTMPTSQTEIQFHHHILFHQSLLEWTTNLESFVFPMKKAASATLLKREICLTLRKLFIQLSKKLNKKNQEMGKTYVQLHYKKTRLLPEKPLVLEERDLICMSVSQAVIFGLFFLQAQTLPEVIIHIFPTSLMSNLQNKLKKRE